MALANSSTEYGLLSKTIHWLMALMIITLIGVGIYMAGLPKETAEQKQYAFQFYGLHKSFGVLAMVLIVVRLVWIRLSPAPALPAVFSAKEQRVTNLVKAFLYILMLLVPLSGYLMSNAGGFPIHFFGLGELPTIIGKSKEIGGIAHEAHEIMGFALLALLLLHIAGAVKHRVKDKGGESDILKRML